MLNVSNYVIIGRITDIMNIMPWAQLDNNDLRIQASINISKFPIKTLIPSSLDMPVADRQTGYANVDRFCNYNIVMGLLSHTASLMLIVDGFPDVCGHRLADVLYTTVSNTIPRRVRESKEMGISSSNVPDWYKIFKYAERVQYKRLDFNPKSEVNSIDDKIKGLLNTPIKETMDVYFSSKVSPAVMASFKAMPEKYLNLTDNSAIDKEFPYTTDLRDLGYRRVDAVIDQRNNYKDAVQNQEEDEPEKKIEIASH